VEPNVRRGWSDLHLGLSGLLALLLLQELCRHAVRRLPLLREVLLSRLLGTLLGRRLLCACGALELLEHLRHLMVTEPDADLERGLSIDRSSRDVRAELRQHLHRLHVPGDCRPV
jgi:hypothetical protein